MEALVFFGLIAAGVAAGVVAIALALKASFWILFAVALPLFWLWMLIDAIARRTEDYPSKSTNEKILWIVLMIVFQVSAAVYWFMVWRAARSRETAAAKPPAPQPQVGMVPAPQPAAPAQPPAV